MTEETTEAAAPASGEASAKKGGTQFIIKMIFLALIVLAIVFYVRSLDHGLPATTTTHAPETEVSAEVEPATAPQAVEEVTVPPVEAAPAIASDETAPEESPAAAPGHGKPLTEEPASPAAGESPAKGESEPPASAPAAAAAQAPVTAEEAMPAAEGVPAEQLRFRPMTEDDVLRQIQEVFAPETLEAAPSD